MSEFLDFLYSLRDRGSSYGLQRMQEFTRLLGNPQNSFPSIHVAGTNGKGSVCSMLSAIYRNNGYKVGMFTSPHLVELGERVQVNGEILSIDEIERIITQVRPIAEKMETEVSGMHPTFFELMTALAFLTFRKSEVDLAILETGLGGRLDSTNVVSPILSIITSISLDHCELLGNEIKDIACEKAGIIKPGVPILSGVLPEDALNVVQEFAGNRGSQHYDLMKMNRDHYPTTNLTGYYQPRNAALALKTTEILNHQFPVDEEKTKQGLHMVELEGRWQFVQGSPSLILDASHNQEGFAGLEKNLANFEKPFIAWLGAMGEERGRRLIESIVPFNPKEIVLFQSEQVRACSREFLKSIIPDSYGGRISFGSWKKLGEKLKRSKKEPVVLVAGSIYLVGAVLSEIRNRPSNTGLSLQDLV